MNIPLRRVWIGLVIFGVFSAVAQNVPLNTREDFEDTLFLVMRLIEAPCPEAHHNETTLCAVHGYDSIFDFIERFSNLRLNAFTTPDFAQDTPVREEHLIQETRWRLVNADAFEAQATFRIVATDARFQLTVFAQPSNLLVIEGID
jgi:hypothetical protein